jgi:hypothetical protein
MALKLAQDVRQTLFCLHPKQLSFDFKNKDTDLFALDAFHLRSDMSFPHVDQSSLFFNMFVLLHIGQKLHTQFLKF